MPTHLAQIPRELFQKNRKLTSVTFPSKCITHTIGHGAFNECSSLTYIELPEQIRSIQDRAFYRCKELKQIIFPKDLKRIGDYAFYFCGIETLNLPDGIEYLGESAFFKCKHLIDVELPPSVKHIGKGIFHGCNRLKYLTIRHDPQYIGEGIINKAATIRCYKNSKTDKYCQENNLNVEYLEGRMPLNIWK